MALGIEIGGLAAHGAASARLASADEDRTLARYARRSDLIDPSFAVHRVVKRTGDGRWLSRRRSDPPQNRSETSRSPPKSAVAALTPNH